MSERSLTTAAILIDTIASRATRVAVRYTIKASSHALAAELADNLGAALAVEVKHDAERCWYSVGDVADVWYEAELMSP